MLITRIVRSYIVVILLCLIATTTAFASVAPEPTLPITSVEWQGQYARIPDWSQITFHTLPPIQTAGSLAIPADISRTLGYDPSRQWKAGQAADTYLKLGDFQTSLYPQVFNLYTIAQLTHLDLNRVALSAVELVAWQTLHDLIAAMPELGEYQVSAIQPIWALLNSKATGTPGFNPKASLNEILQANPALETLNLGQLGKQLDRFAITEIPGLENVALQSLANWENSTIAGVPGLANVPLSQMPNPISVTGAVGSVDVVYGAAESDRKDTISGSYQEGFAVACEHNCAHIEMTGSPELNGKQWISGQSQKVRGGFGVLGAINGGLEPTGRHPFGDAFKVAVWDVEESTGTVSTALFFRICKRKLPDLGCTPYFIGPIPFLNYQETALIFTGDLNAQGGSSPAKSVPTSVPQQPKSRAKAKAPPKKAIRKANQSALCGRGLGGVNFNALEIAFSSIEGNYKSVGSYVCDGDGNCGRGLGRYQYMSYRSDVRALIRQRAGGAAFLAKADAGTRVSGAEVERVFPAAAQDQLFRSDQTQNIRQAMREGFSGERLIERVGQIHFGGSGAPIDGGASDIHGRLTLKTYGQELRAECMRHIQSGNGKACVNA
jgi:hypothetical protein